MILYFPWCELLLIVEFCFRKVVGFGACIVAGTWLLRRPFVIAFAIAFLIGLAFIGPAFDSTFHGFAFLNGFKSFGLKLEE